MIRITEGHIFLNEFDISPFVDRKSVKIEGDRVTLVLLGEVIYELEKPKKSYKTKKDVEVEDG